MRGSRKILLALGGILCLTTRVASPAAKPRSTSTSRQFLVYGADVRLRGAVCDLAEETKTNLLHLLELRDNWKTPLIVNLDYPQANLPGAPPARLEVSQLGYGLKLQLNLLVTKEIRGRNVEEELLRAILVEMMYRERGNIAAGTPYVTPPDWLVAGVLRSQPGSNSDDDAELLQSVVAANRIAPLEEIVGQRRARLDAPSRKFFDAYSRALLQLLLGARGGPGKLRQFIADLPVAPNDALADLRVHFPETLGRSPAKWWTLSVARLSAADRFETLSAKDTARQLDRILRFPIPGRDGQTHEYSLGEYEAFRKLPASRAILQRVSRQLLLLGARSHPSYRPIVQEDYALAELLARGKTRRVEERLERVASYRSVVETQTKEIDDYLNWYEGTQAKTISGAFSQVLKVDEADDAQPRRRDPISVYLDSIEMEME